MPKKKLEKKAEFGPADVFIGDENVSYSYFVEHAEIEVILQCPRCEGRGVMAHPFEGAASLLKGFKTEQLAGLLTKKARDMLHGGKKVPSVTCTLCQGKKRISRLVSCMALLGTDAERKLRLEKEIISLKLKQDEASIHRMALQNQHSD